NQFTCLQGRDYGYGFGVRVRKVATDWGLPQGEFGWDGAAGSYLMIDPINKVSIVMGMNVKGWPSIFQDKHLEIVKLIYEKFFT
ncbi:MAG: serine hydrolase, partial [Clostridia bacterium]|nr:serine hydrolase [Clostridia bacterium]